MWGNLSYLHAIFDHIFRVWSLFSEHDAHFKTLPLRHGAPITGGAAETYGRIAIAYPEKKIHNIKHTGVFCVDKTGFSDSVTYAVIQEWLKYCEFKMGVV